MLLIGSLPGGVRHTYGPTEHAALEAHGHDGLAAIRQSIIYTTSS